MSPAFWAGKRVFLTGHTGFKGSWLAVWLAALGAKVTGYALAAPSRPSLWELVERKAGVASVIGDIRDAGVGAAVLAHENVNTRLSEPPPGAPAPSVRALPTETYYGDGMKLSHFFNGEGVELLHTPAAHTDGDTVVYFPDLKVVAVGDLFAQPPDPDFSAGGSMTRFCRAAAMDTHSPVRGSCRIVAVSGRGAGSRPSGLRAGASVLSASS